MTRQTYMRHVSYTAFPETTMTEQHPAVEAVKNALKERTFSQGRIQVSSDKLLLFYSKRQEEKAGTAQYVGIARLRLSFNLFHQLFEPWRCIRDIAS